MNGTCGSFGRGDGSEDEPPEAVGSTIDEGTFLIVFLASFIISIKGLIALKRRNCNHFRSHFLGGNEGGYMRRWERRIKNDLEKL